MDSFISLFANKLSTLISLFVRVCVVFMLFLSVNGCKAPVDHRLGADKAAEDIIAQKQIQAIGRQEEFYIERPSDILRRRLLADQNLPISSNASLGSDALEQIKYWPEEDYPRKQLSSDLVVTLEPNKPVQLSLIEALQIGARNSFDYQSQKEQVFQSALALDLERDDFRNTFAGQVSTLLSTDLSGDRTVTGTETSGELGLSKKLESGAELSAAIAVDLANLLTMGGASSIGIVGDASVSIPLLRGSGKHIVTESLTQAERNVVYSIYEFERFKRSFAVDIAKSYLSVLQQMDQVANSEQNYRTLVASARRARRLGQAGRQTEIQVGLAEQDELRARNGWISATESYKSSLDSFKMLLGLPPDAKVEVDRGELDVLVAPGMQLVTKLAQDQDTADVNDIPAADAPVVLEPPSRENAGRFELDESIAIRLGLDNRLDLRVRLGKVYDAQRAVVVAADALRAELTLLGRASAGGGRSVSTATSDDADLRLDEGSYSGLLTLDPGLERTRERNAYRNSLISLEQSVRNVQTLEDQIKLAVRNKLRDMFESRESLQIQAKAVHLAEKRVKSTNLFLEAGRAEIRDLLEAQESLLSAQNSLTRAVVNYRVAELEMQRDTGLLQVNEKGLWHEYIPEAINNAEKK